MKKKFKCSTFPSEDSITFDYGKGHVLVTSLDSKYNKETSICLDDKNIDQLIKYLLSVRGLSI